MMEFIEWLASTSSSVALRESLYLYPWIESAHVLFIAIFFGTLLFVDLRLSGYVFKELSISEMNKKVLPLTIIGFISSGVALSTQNTIGLTGSDTKA